MAAICLGLNANVSTSLGFCLHWFKHLDIDTAYVASISFHGNPDVISSQYTIYLSLHSNNLDWYGVAENYGMYSYVLTKLTNTWLHLNYGVLCQKQVSRARTSNYIPHIYGM